MEMIRIEAELMLSLHRRQGEWVPTTFFGGNHADRLVEAGYIERRPLDKGHELRITDAGVAYLRDTANSQDPQ